MLKDRILIFLEFSANISLNPSIISQLVFRSRLYLFA